MAFDSTKWEAAIDLLRQGSLWCAQYMKVDWGNGAEVRYISTTPYSYVTGYRDIRNHIGGGHIEARIIGEFPRYEIYGDIRTESIETVLDDADGEMWALFKEHGAAKVDIFEYYPQKDLLVNAWWGQLLPPQVQGKFVQRCMVTNGYRTRELTLPSGPTMPEECPATFGGRLNTLDKIATNLCPYAKHLGGEGNNNPSTSQPYIDCDQSRTGCIARFGHDRYFAGVDLNIAPHYNEPGGIARTKGNATIRNKPATWIIGYKVFRGADLVLMGREFNQSNPDAAWVVMLWRLGKGPVQDIQRLSGFINEQWIEDLHMTEFRGERGQTKPDYPNNTNRFSGVAMARVRWGKLNPMLVTMQGLALQIYVLGDNTIAVWEEDPENPGEYIFTRRFTNDRVWALIEMYTNQTAGLRYEPSRFHIDRAVAASEEARKEVTHTFTHEDGEVRSFTAQRTMFDAAIAPQPAVDVIANVCKSGRLSIPYQYDGKYSIRFFKAYAEGELTAARVFSDHGDDQNIIWQGDQPVLFDSTPLERLPNEIEFTYDERLNMDIPRTIYVDDKDTQRRASKIAGDEALTKVIKKFTGLGVKGNEEAVMRARWLLYFGEYDPATGGGIKNNCIAKFVVPRPWVLGLEKYSPIRLDVTGMTVPEDPDGNPFEYFIFCEAKPLENDQVMITAIAYNQTEAEAFETESEGEALTDVCSIDDDCSRYGEGWVCRNGVCYPPGVGSMARPSINVTYDDETGNLIVDPITP